LNATANFHLHGELVALLQRERRGGIFAYTCARAASLKNAIETLGVPHTEVGRLLVNGAPATLARTVREGDAIEVFPWRRDAGAHENALSDANIRRATHALPADAGGAAGTAAGGPFSRLAWLGPHIGPAALKTLDHLVERRRRDLDTWQQPYYDALLAQPVDALVARHEGHAGVRGA